MLYKKGSLMVIHPSFGKMICCSAILLLSLFVEPNLGQSFEGIFEPSLGQSFEGLASLISNLVSLDNSDLVFISDFQTPQQVFLTLCYTVFENHQKCLILVTYFNVDFCKVRLRHFVMKTLRICLFTNNNHALKYHV